MDAQALLATAADAGPSEEAHAPEAKEEEVGEAEATRKVMEVRLEGISGAALRVLVHFIYTGFLLSSTSAGGWLFGSQAQGETSSHLYTACLMEVLDVAEEYLLPQLKHDAAEALADCITVERSVDILASASANGLHRLRAATRRFILEHFRAVTATPGFRATGLNARGLIVRILTGES